MAAYATLDDIMAIYGISERTARRWADQDGWRCVDTWPRQYAVADAQASYDARTRPARIRAHLEHRYAWLLPATGELAAAGTGTGTA